MRIKNGREKKNKGQEIKIRGSAVEERGGVGRGGEGHLLVLEPVHAHTAHSDRFVHCG